jgi:glycosyltransferase involved in cell wall biosynthesis
MAENEIRVLHIDSQKEWRGGQQQAVNLYEALRAKGYQTMFACSSNSKLKSYFVERKLPFFEVAMFGEIDFISAFKISIYCRKNNYNVLCLHSAGAHSIGLMAKIFYPKLVIIGIRRVDFKIKSNFLSQKKYKSSLVNSIVCISNEIKRVMLECGISEDKLKVIHSGININKFSNDKPEPRLKQEINIPDNEIVIGTIAALEGHKDYPNLLNAAKKVLEKRNNVTFVAVGEGKKRDELIELHKELDLGKKFKFVGYQSNVSKYLFLFDVFVLASKTEGLGTSILDAQSIGLPVVATNVGGIPEAVQNNYNGILVEAQNANELAEAIIKLVDNKELRKQLGLKGRESVKNFDTQLTTEKYLELFRTLR